MNSTGMIVFFVENSKALLAKGFSPLEVVGALEIAKAVTIQTSIKLVPQTILPSGGPLPPPPGRTS